MAASNKTQEFIHELNKLNPAQKEAVNTIEGPVLVIAGPGTGKTQILAARIGNILLETDTLPHHILCLTYTDAGTIAMRKRLLQFIGPDAYRVNIHTFHSFCNMVIQENLDHFGLRALEPISELERIEVVHEIIDEFKLDNPLKRLRGEVYFDTNNLIGLFDLMKREDWNPSFIEAKVQEYLEDLPNREEFIYKVNMPKLGKKVGDLKEKPFNEEKERMQKLLAAADAFHTYQKKLEARRRYDYADMILWTIRAFKENEGLLMNYQERFLYVLVDEFQDTSGAQSEVLNLLIDYWDSPNVFVVGDDDQSIFAFQDANVSNIIQFDRKYSKDLKRIMMTENYRSTQAVLDLAGELIENNTERLVSQIPGLEKKLTASLPSLKNDPTLPVIRYYYNTYHETVHIAKQIQALRDQGVNLSEIAVIYRKHAQAEFISKYLQVLEVPVNIKKELNVLDEPIVNQLISILRYIQAENTKPHSGEDLLFKILHYRFFNLNPLDIAAIAVEVNELNDRKRIASFRALLAKRARNRDLFQEMGNPESLQRASDDIEFWIGNAHELTLQQLLEKIINRGGLLKLALTSPDKVWLMQVIHTFFEFVKDQCARNTKMGIKEFLEMVDLMESNQLVVPVQRVSYAAEGVNFLTAHGSKGLEFDYVFLIGCDANSWHGAPRRGFKLPGTLTPRVEVNEDEENRRLFYVALTRAKRHLYVSFAENNIQGKALERSAYVAEIEEAQIAEQERIALPNEDLLDFQDTVLQEIPVPHPDLVDKEFLMQKLDKFTMSVTNLNSYLKCPLSFYFDNLLRVPRAKSPTMTFGSAVHFALESLFKRMLEDPNKTFPDAETFLSGFEWYMSRNADSFTEKEYQRALNNGHKELPAYYEHYVQTWHKEVEVEKPFKNIEVKGVPINGKIDKIEIYGKEAVLIDYKTGKFENAKGKFDPPNLEKIKDQPLDEVKYEHRFGGDYWRQAVFYSILMESDPTHQWNMQSAEFDFVELDEKKKEFVKKKVFVESKDREIVIGQIVDSYARIKNLDFEGCGKSDCNWCNFARNHYRSPDDSDFPPDEEV